MSTRPVDCHLGKATTPLKATCKLDKTSNSSSSERGSPDHIDDFTDGDSDCDVNDFNGPRISLEKVDGFQRIWKQRFEDCVEEKDDEASQVEELFRRTDDVSLPWKDVYYSDYDDDDDCLGVVQLHWCPTYVEFLEIENYWLAWEVTRKSTTESSPVKSQPNSELEPGATLTDSFSRIVVFGSSCEVSDASIEEFECPLIEAEDSSRFFSEVQGKSVKLFSRKSSVRNNDKHKVEEFLFGARSEDEMMLETRKSPLPAHLSCISASDSGDEDDHDFPLDDTLPISDHSDGGPNNDQVLEKMSESNSSSEEGRVDSSDDDWETKKKPKKVKKFVLPLKWKLQHREKIRERNKLRREAAIANNEEVAEKKIRGFKGERSDAVRKISVKSSKKSRKKLKSAGPESSESEDEFQKKKAMPNGHFSEKLPQSSEQPSKKLPESSEQHSEKLPESSEQLSEKLPESSEKLPESSEQLSEKSAPLDSNCLDKDSWLQDVGLMRDKRLEWKKKSALFALLRTFPSSSDSEDDSRKKREKHDHDSSLDAANNEDKDSDSCNEKSKDTQKSRRLMSNVFSSVLSREINGESGRDSSSDARVASICECSSDDSDRPKTTRRAASDSSSSAQNKKEDTRKNSSEDDSSNDDECEKQKRSRRSSSDSSSSAQNKKEDIRRNSSEDDSSNDDECEKQKLSRRSSSDSSSSAQNKKVDIRRNSSEDDSSNDDECEKQKRSRRSSSDSSSSAQNKIEKILKKSSEDDSSNDDECEKQKRSRRSSSDSSSSAQNKIEDVRKNSSEDDSSNDDECEKQKRSRRSSSDSSSSAQNKKEKILKKSSEDDSSNDDECEKQKRSRRSSSDSSSSAQNKIEDVRKNSSEDDSSNDDECEKQKRSRRSSSDSSSSAQNKKEKILKKSSEDDSSNDDECEKQKRSRRSSSDSSSSAQNKKEKILKKSSEDDSPNDDECEKQKRSRRSSSDSSSSAQNKKEKILKKSSEDDSSNDDECEKQKRSRRSSSDSSSSAQNKIEDVRKNSSEDDSSNDDECEKQKRSRRSSSDSSSSAQNKKEKILKKSSEDDSSNDDECEKQKRSRRSSSDSSSSAQNKKEKILKKSSEDDSSNDDECEKQKRSRRSSSNSCSSAQNKKEKILKKSSEDDSSNDDECEKQKRSRRSSSDSSSSAQNKKEKIRKKGERSEEDCSNNEKREKEKKSRRSSSCSVSKSIDGEELLKKTEERDSLSEARVVDSRNSNNEESKSLGKAKRCSSESSDSVLKRSEVEDPREKQEAGHDSPRDVLAANEESALATAMDSCCDELAKNSKSDSSNDDSDSGKGPSLDVSRSKVLRKKRKKRDRDICSIVNDREALAKKDLLESSDSDSDDAEKKMKLPLKMSRPSTSESDDDSPRGDKRSASEDGEPTKRQKPCIDVTTDAKLLASCFVSVQRMGEEHLEKYLFALQGEYLEKAKIDRLCNFNAMRYTGRTGCREEDDEQKLRRAKIEKVKMRGKGLMDFFDDEASDDPVMGNDEPGDDSHDEKKRTLENGIDTWSNVNKDTLLNDSDAEHSSSDKSASDDSDQEKEKKTKKKMKKKKSGEEEEDVKNGKSSNDGMNTDPVSSGNEDFVKKKKKDWRKHKLLVGKLCDTDSDEAMAKAQRKNVKSDDEEEKVPKRRKKSRRSVFSSSDSEPESKSSSPDTSDLYSRAVEIDAKRRIRRKRKRIRPQNSSSDDDDDDGIFHTPKKNRKKMRYSSFNYWSPVKETRNAGKAEDERRRRIEERQKMYDRMYSDLQAEACGQKLDKLILDFDEKTKEPLVEVHPSIVVKLKPHQIEGVRFMWNACFESLARVKKTKGTGCILAHCMGLGKTFQVVTLCHTVLKNPACMTRTILIVAPLSTVLNWCSEFDKWLSGLGGAQISVQNLTEVKVNSRRQWKLQEWSENGGVMVLGYEMYRNLTSTKNKNFPPEMIATFQETLVDPGPDLVVCDEGHLLKNANTAITSSMSKVRTSRRIVLTGTPLQNNLREYHVMVQFVKPYLLGTTKEFKNHFILPITDGQFEDSGPMAVRMMKKKAHVLHQLLKGSVQRYDYSVLTPFLPPKEEYVICLRVTPLQEDLYNYYLENLSRSNVDDYGKTISKYAVLFKDFNSLLKVWTHPLLLKWGTEQIEENKRCGKKNKKKKDDFVDDRNTSECTLSSSSEDLDAAIEKKRKKKKTNEESSVVPLSGEPKEEPELPLTYWWKRFVTRSHLDDIRESPKLVLLFSILKKCEAIGEKVLVFSQSLFTLDLIEHFLEKIDEATRNDEDDERLLNHRGLWTCNVDYFRLDGSTPTDVRAAWCRTFNKVDNLRGRLFLISTKAGGLGINLVAANRVVLFDASWNPSHDLQSIFRVYRFGQKKPAFVYRFIAQGTMEEKIYKRQVTKLSLAHRVIDEHQIDRHYNMKILQELYCFMPFVGPKQIPNCPKDHMFADLLRKHDAFIVSYHEHDSLLENKVCEELSEAERKEAWEEYEREKKLNAVRYGDLNPDSAPEPDDPNCNERDGYAATLGNHPVPYGLPGPSLGGSPRNSSPPPRSISLSPSSLPPPSPNSSCPPSSPTPSSSRTTLSSRPSRRSSAASRGSTPPFGNDGFAGLLNQYFEDSS